VLRLELAVEGTLGQAGFAADLRDAGPVEPSLLKQSPGCRHQRGAMLRDLLPRNLHGSLPISPLDLLIAASIYGRDDSDRYDYGHLFGSRRRSLKSTEFDKTRTNPGRSIPAFLCRQTASPATSGIHRDHRNMTNTTE
jgi:hypothetical protein